MAGATPAVAQTQHFNRVAAFPVALNLPEGADPATVTSAEIATANGDGITLVYTDSPNQAIGFIDIADPAAPAPLGSLAFDGEPTAVSILDATAFVGVNTGASFTDPSGRLAAVDLTTRAETASCDLGGHPIPPRSPRTAASSPSPSRTSATRTPATAACRRCPRVLSRSCRSWTARCSAAP